MTTESHTPPAKPKKTRAELFGRASIGPEEAYKIYKDQPVETRSARSLHRLLVNQGHKISHMTVVRWFHRPEFILLQNERSARATKSTRAMKTLLQIMADKSLQLSAASIQGLQVYVLERLCAATDTVKIDSPDDFSKMLDCCDRLRGMVHDVRGDKVGHGDEVSVVPPSKPAVVTNLGSFKKPNGNGVGTTHG